MTHRVAFREARLARALGLAVAAALCALALTAAPSHAGLLVASAPDCTSGATSRPFLPWLDLASYTLAPDGGFENRARGWELRGGATTVAGNEPFAVGGAGDRASLRVPAGGSATSPVLCVGLEHPTVRMFAKRVGGSLLSTLRVDVTFEDALGAKRTLPVGVVLGDGRWAPTLPMPVLANLLPLLPGSHTPITVRLVPQGSATWLVDDVYVDPFKRG